MTTFGIVKLTNVISTEKFVFPGITFIRHVESQKNEKLNNIKVFGWKKPKELKQDSQNQPRLQFLEPDYFLSLISYNIQ